jgi:hypothetical protein
MGSHIPARYSQVGFARMSRARLCLMLVLFAVSASLCPANPQNENPAPTAQKPVRKPDQIPSNDSVALLAMRIVQETPTTVTNPGSPALQPVDETHKKAAEIVYLESQIQEKTERIYFLMRLFVADERRFLNDPANQNVPGAVHDERRYEQDELLWETAELARLKHRLNEIKASH